ncbi:MAG: cytochrome P450 [Solirubrobacteraceae bacterium]
MRDQPPSTSLSGALVTLRFLVRPVAVMHRLQQELGDTFMFEIGGVQATVMITKPDDVKTVFTAPHEDMPTVSSSTSLGILLGRHSVLTLNGPQHIRQRRLLSPSFRGDRLKPWAPLIEQLTHDRIDQWRPGQEFRLQEEMQAITFDTILAVVFGMEDAARQDALRDILIGMTKRATNSARSVFDMVLAARGRLAGPMAKLGKAMDEIVYKEIAHHRQMTDLAERNDMLSLLMLAEDEDGNGMTDEELRDELVTLLLVGHETTATSLAWGAERLLRTPDALEKLTTALAGPDGGDEYLDATVNEILRDRPVVPIIGRELRKPLTLDGYEIGAGETVNVNLWLVNHRADTYPEPFRFSPDRFVGKRPDTYAWVPFGGGIRRCLGAAFAEMEMRHVMRVLYSRVQMSTVDPTPERPVLRAVTLAPQHGTRVRIEAIKERPEPVIEAVEPAAAA